MYWSERLLKHHSGLWRQQYLFMTHIWRAPYARICQFFWRVLPFHLRACTGVSKRAPPTEWRKCKNCWKTKGKHMETNISLYKSIQNQSKTSAKLMKSWENLPKPIKPERKPFQRKSGQGAKPYNPLTRLWRAPYALMARDKNQYRRSSKITRNNQT